MNGKPWHVIELIDRDRIWYRYINSTDPTAPISSGMLNREGAQHWCDYLNALERNVTDYKYGTPYFDPACHCLFIVPRDQEPDCCPGCFGGPPLVPVHQLLEF